uniref:Uncharacterized protein n=1 Tax=Percolomonas cosmopolitus TaxID=63605 RepID=A0A7S1KMF1_9EUKA
MTRAGQRYATQWKTGSSLGMGRIKLKNADSRNSDASFNKMMDKYKRGATTNREASSVVKQWRDGSQRHRENNDGRPRRDEDASRNGTKRTSVLKEHERSGPRPPMPHRRPHRHAPREEEGYSVVQKETDAAVEMKSGSKFVFCLADEVESVSSSDSEDEMDEEQELFPFVEYLQKYKPSLAGQIHELHPTWYDTLYREMKEIYLKTTDMKRRKKAAARKRKKLNKEKKEKDDISAKSANLSASESDDDSNSANSDASEQQQGDGTSSGSSDSESSTSESDDAGSR